MTYSTTPTAAELRALSTAELGVLILRSGTVDLNPRSMFLSHNQAHRQNSEPDADDLLATMSDAWAWLIANGLVGPDPQKSDGWYRITAKGRGVAELGSARELLAEQRLPDDLHERLAHARGLYLAGDSETAVFAAMKQVEVRLRELGKFGNDSIGVPLARDALDAEKGPLRDPELEPAERQAIAHLFAGALGAFKNPASHRPVDFDDPAVAADIIVLADLLMRLLDQRVSL